MKNNATSDMKTLARSDIMSFAQCILELVCLLKSAVRAITSLRERFIKKKSSIRNKTLQVANSLAAQATAIAIRIRAEKREIRVIDNGVGMQESMLEDVAEYNAKIISNRRRMYGLIESSNCTLINIRRLSDTLTVVSRHRHSTETFMKVHLIERIQTETLLKRMYSVRIKTI